MTKLNGPQKGRILLGLPLTGAPQKLTYLQLDSIHSSPSLSLGNMTQSHVLWMHLQLVGVRCILCISAILTNSLMPAKDFGGTSTSGNHDLTLLAHPSLVATTVEDVNCNPISVAKAGGPTFTITFSSNSTPP